MRRIITTAVLALVGSSAAVGPALATTPPDTTPDTEPPAGSNVPTDTTGATASTDEPVVVVDDSGSPIAAITVTSIEPSRTGFGEYPLPDVGYEYLRVTVVVAGRSNWR